MKDFPTFCVANWEMIRISFPKCGDAYLAGPCRLSEELEGSQLQLVSPDRRRSSLSDDRMTTKKDPVSPQAR